MKLTTYLMAALMMAGIAGVLAQTVQPEPFDVPPVTRGVQRQDPTWYEQVPCWDKEWGHNGRAAMVDVNGEWSAGEFQTWFNALPACKERLQCADTSRILLREESGKGHCVSLKALGK